MRIAGQCVDWRSSLSIQAALASPVTAVTRKAESSASKLIVASVY